jgi:hypothetical protein
VASVVNHINNVFPDPVIICPCDDDETSKLASNEGAIVPSRTTRIGYGKSLVEGLRLAYHTFNCDYIIEMDVDHSVHEVKNLFDYTKENDLDMCVGNEQAKWKSERRVACWLANFFLVNSIVGHPTCGLVCFRKEVLSSIPWKHIKSNRDFVHIELLYWAKQGKFKIGEYIFSGHGGERNYSIRRILDWLINFSRLLQRKYL